MVCRMCGWQNEQGATKCAGCGASLGAPPPSPARPTASRPARSSARWWILGGVLVAVAVAGVLVGLMVVYPKMQAERIREAYSGMAAAVEAGDLDSVIAKATGEAKSDLEALKPLGNMVRAKQGIAVTCKLDITNVTVKGSAATATVHATLGIGGSIMGQRLDKTQDATETHAWTREGGAWKLSSWGAESGVHQFAGYMRSNAALLRMLGLGG